MTRARVGELERFGAPLDRYEEREPQTCEACAMFYPMGGLSGVCRESGRVEWTLKDVSEAFIDHPECPNECPAFEPWKGVSWTA